MKLRKLNAVISLITTVLILDHSIFYSVWMLSRGSVAKSADALPWVLTVLALIHTVLCIVIIARQHKDKAKQPHNSYAKLNAGTVIQRASGILMVVLLAVHIGGAANHFRAKIFHTVMHPLFFAAVLAHISVSVSKAFVTLGVGNAKVIKALDVLMPIVCAAIFLAGVIGFYMCLFLGVAK